MRFLRSFFSSSPFPFQSLALSQNKFGGSSEKEVGSLDRVVPRLSRVESASKKGRTNFEKGRTPFRKTRKLLSTKSDLFLCPPVSVPPYCLIPRTFSALGSSILALQDYDSGGYGIWNPRYCIKFLLLCEKIDFNIGLCHNFCHFFVAEKKCTTFANCRYPNPLQYVVNLKNVTT